MSYTLTINTDKGDLSVKWTNVDDLAKFANLQSGFYFSKDKKYTSDLLFEKFTNWNQFFWDQRRNQGIFNLPENSKILDIGSGVAVIDLLLYSYINKSSFYLVDKDQFDITHLEEDLPKNPYALDYPTYNSWNVVEDAIRTSNFDRSRFNFLDVDSDFPENVDAVTSYFSWCLHYPKEVYWDRVKNSLKKGGLLVLDVRPIHERDVIGEISEELKSNPTKHAFPVVDIDSYKPVDDGVSCYRCVWIKNI